MPADTATHRQYRRRSRSPLSRSDEPSSSKRQLEHRPSRRSRSPTARHSDREPRGQRDSTPDRDRSNRPRSRSRSHSPSRRKRYASRSRSGSRDRERRGDRRERRKRARSRSSSPSGSDDSRSRHKKERKKDKKRSGSKERRKREKKEKKKKRGANTSHWGKHGILTDLDIFTKQGEFHAWLVEERKVNPETVTKDQERKEFARFIEDYNTATLPHEKYYNMEAYDKRMNALRQGEYLPPTNDLYDFEADVKAVKTAHKKKPAEQESYLSREELMELRKVQQERVELGKMKLLGMDIKSTYGVRMDKTDFDD